MGKECMPKVSVVISTHHGRKERCKKAIQSVLKQTYTDLELIVVDDASQDGTTEMVGNLADKRITYVRRDENFGTDTKPKNEGILASQGSYIAFLDSDNTMRPDHLSALVKALENAPENVAMVYGDRWINDETGQLPAQLGVTSEYNPNLLMVRNYIDTSDVLIRREALFDVGGFDERYRKYVDWNLWVRLCKAGYDFQRVPLVLTDYVLHEDSKSFRPEDEREPLVPAWDAIDCEIQVPHLGEIKAPRVAIYSLVYDRPEYTDACFKSLYKTAGYEFDHYVVAQTPADAEFMEKFAKEQGIEVEVIG